jgi:hypothetical protein
MLPIDLNRLNGPQRKILRETLTSVFRRSRELDIFLQENGFEPLEDIVESGPFKQQVFALIAELARIGRLDRLIQEVRTAFRDNRDLEELDGRLILANSEAESQRVVKVFTGQEFGLERMVREAGFADVNLWAGQLLAAGRRVCRISYPVANGCMRGSGFLVGRDLVLTNYHVVEALLEGKATPDAVRVNFGFAETEDGPAVGEKYWLAEKWMVAQSPYGLCDVAPGQGHPADNELDFALLRLEKPAGDAQGAAGKRGWFNLGKLPEPAGEGSIVFVLQHPEGKPLKQSIGVIKSPVTALRLRYDADTDHGSSGGLVLDQQLEPVALHHAGDPNSKIKAQYNQGIPLTLIRSALAANPNVPAFWTDQAERTASEVRG